MIRPAHLTEDQWFMLCYRLYRYLRMGDPKLAFHALEKAGFDELTKSIVP